MIYFKVFFIIQLNVKAHISSAADGLKEQQSAGWERLLSLMINQPQRLFHAVRSPLFEEGRSRQSKQQDGACRHDSR